MATAVLQHAWNPGTPALELGAGVGLVGLAACHAGLNVVFTDYDPLAVDLCVHNAHRQGFPQARGAVVDWEAPPRDKYPLIFGCELLYEDRNHDLLIPLLQQQLSDDGVAWFGDGGRVRAERFCRLLSEHGFRYRLSDESGSPLPILRVGRYQLIEVRRGT
jgi:predicted nicotinamide N-methyase